MPKLMTFYIVSRPDEDELISDTPDHPLDLALHRYFPFPPSKGAEYEALLDFCVHVPVVEHYMDMERIRQDYHLQENATWRREDKDGGIILNGALDIRIPSGELDAYRCERVVKWPVTRRDEFAKSNDNALYAKLLACHSECDFEINCYHKLSPQQVEIVYNFFNPTLNLINVFMYVQEVIGIPGSRWRVEPCMCGRGKVGFYTNNDGFEFPTLHCDHCSRWWHVTPNGYLRKHIALKYPHHKFGSSPFFDKLWMTPLPSFVGERILNFMNDAEKKACFGDGHSSDYTTKELNSACFYMRRRYSLDWACILAFMYTKEELQGILDMMHEGPSNLRVRSILALDVRDSYFQWITTIKHAIMYYKQYREHLAEWESYNRSRIIRFREAREQSILEHLMLERQHRDDVIPWSKIHKRKDSLN